MFLINKYFVYICYLVLIVFDAIKTEHRNGWIPFHFGRFGFGLSSLTPMNRLTHGPGYEKAPTIWAFICQHCQQVSKTHYSSTVQLGLTASKMNVLHHLAMQSEALVILLQETHCTDAEKLVLPNYQLAGSSLSRKHGLPAFVHERLRYTLLDQSPPTSEIEWLCVDVDGYKVVNVYKPPPTRLRSLDLPVFPHPCLFKLVILTVVMLTGVTMTTVRTVSAWLAGQVLIVLPSYIMPRTLSIFIQAAGTLAPIQI